MLKSMAFTVLVSDNELPAGLRVTSSHVLLLTASQFRMSSHPSTEGG